MTAPRAVLLLLPLLAGCGSRTAPAITDLRPVADFNFGEPITEEECLAFARSVERAVDEGDKEAFDACFDWEALLDRATAGVPVAPALRRTFVQRARESTGRLTLEVIGRVQDGGSYELLRIHSVEGELRARFRLVLPEGSVNYHDLMLARRPDGIKVVDVDLMLAGDNLAGISRRLYLPVALDSSRGLLGRLFPTDRDLVRSFGKLRQLSDAVRDGQDEDALDAYAQLPESLRKEKFVLLLRVQAAQGVDEARYREAMADFRANHPDDPCLDLVCLDHLILTGKHDDALASIERLEQAVGGDPFLDVLRAGILLGAGRLPEARASAQKAVDARPDRADGYWALLKVALRQRRFREALQLLQTLEENFGAALDDLASQPEYEELFRSPEYETWVAERAKAAEKKEK